MNRLLVGVGMMICAFTSFGEPSSMDSWSERQSWQDLSIIAALGPRLSARDWAVAMAVLAFAALNMFLWTLPMTQTKLFLLSFPVGLAAIVAFTWYVGRD